MKQKILQAAISIISHQQKTSDFDHVRQSPQQNHDEYLQKIAENSSSIDKIQNTMNENCKKLKMIEDNFNMLQNILDRNNKNLDINMKKLREQCQLQLTHSQKTLQEKFDKYEHMFNSIEKSQKQTTDILTEIINVVTSENDKATFGNTTPDM
jgi:hypothetical protein